MAISVAIAVEDDLSESILRRLIQHRRRDLTVGVRYPLRPLPGGRNNPGNVAEIRGLSGFGQIKVSLPAFNNAAATGRPYIVLTDLDIHVRCPGQLLAAWLPRVTPSPNLIFRVAVKEVEAWLLADRVNLAEHLHVNLHKMPIRVERLKDPKVKIVKLVQYSSSDEIQQDMLPENGSTAEVGRCFERVLLNFVRQHWDIDQAASNSRSLTRAIAAIDRFVPQS